MKINVSVGSKSFQLDVLVDEASISTFGDLKTAICQEANLDVSHLKIIHRGKTLAGDDETSLSEFKFKENDKLLVIGKAKAALKDDPGFSSLMKYEKDHLVGLQKQYEDMGTDLAEIEKNHLDADKSREMAKRMDKRLKMFAETGLRHLMAIDGLHINNDETTPDQATRNREKRKTLVNGIQSLLNHSDKNVRRLEEYVKKLDGEILE